MDDHAGPDADIAEIGRWLADPSAVRDLMAELPSLGDEAGARRQLADLSVALEDVKAGRTVSHDVVVRDAAARRSAYHASAAE